MQEHTPLEFAKIRDMSWKESLMRDKYPAFRTSLTDNSVISFDKKLNSYLQKLRPH